MMCRFIIPSCFWLFVVFSIGEFFRPASAGTREDLKDCEKVHFYKPTCPNYEETQQCLNKVKVDSDSDAMSKAFMIEQLKGRKFASCSALTSKGTCVRKEESKCTATFIDLQTKNHPAICMEASKTQVCLQRLANACPHSVRGYEGTVWLAISLNAVDMTIQYCKKGFHKGSCAPRHMDSCVESLLDKVPGGDFVASCPRAQYDAAKSCLEKIKSSCTSIQLHYYGWIYDKLVACPIID